MIYMTKKEIQRRIEDLITIAEVFGTNEGDIKDYDQIKGIIKGRYSTDTNLKDLIKQGDKLLGGQTK